MSKRAWLLGSLLIPSIAVAATGGVAAIIMPTSGYIWAPDVVTLSEAVATGNYAEVVGQIDRGADPNPAAIVRADLLSSHAVRLTPLQAAVWGRNARMLTLLLEHGAIISRSGLTILKCMNERDGDRDVRRVLEAASADFASLPPCSEVELPE